MTDLYAVVGNPIGHSKSPQIHTAFAAQTRQDLLYTAQLVPLDSFDSALNKFFKHGGCGVNVTVPFKENAWRYADEFTPRAQRAQAVNTLKKMADGRILADNTDGVGLVRDLTVNHGVALNGKRILLLGAGGAVRGVLQPLLEQQPAELIIANRTLSKAEMLAKDFADLGNVKASEFAALDGTFDVIINGTSASLSGDLPPLPASVLTAGTVCYDMMYSAQTTIFNQWSLDNGVQKVIDGLGMLVEQAAEAFALWRDVRPETKTVIAVLRGERRHR
ncbi:MAG: shikimate dehydrogenase [Thalassobium sp.]|uniref:Shikimate dehydrogenase (NADP(+)) n=1 Tax=Thalassolituus pacificus TaxID=2975440 RepID=A0A9X2WF35_9GAMM|nr:shikimate dehydrogenase [Thalassolituus pacificus]MCT7359248.1 shikimate dehydrogenase [Thalassolituus pacificus]PHS65153.1 MAG: shikimate dehydrogenase [Thalassobium sp.]